MSADSALPLTIFAFTYLALALGKLPFVRLDRTGAAMVGAVAMIVAGTLSKEAAIQAVDFHTLGLLLGMMIVVADIRLSGLFSYLAATFFRRARTGFGLLALTVAVAGLLAAFFVNDVVCLVLAPVLMDVARDSGIDPVPLMLGLACASNVGSAGTITGNPQNMIVAGFAHLPFLGYMLHVGPGALAGLVVVFAVIGVVYRKPLARKCSLPDGQPPRVVTKLLAAKAAVIAIGALIGFAVGYPTDLVALTAASAVLLVGRSRLERVYEQVDFTMLLMFAGLFVVVAGVQTTGLHKRLLELVGVGRLTHPAILAATIAVLSNLVSNVPAVMLFRPLYPLLGGAQRTAMLLAAASTYAGNLTILGSVANLIVVENAHVRHLEISFAEHLRIGVPITVLTLLIAILTLR